MQIEKYCGHIIDVLRKRIYDGEIHVRDREIISIKESYKVPDVFIMPGLIDAHIHIESSMLVPTEFARVAVRHGTIACVSDPHEIANVLGVKGINFMTGNAQKTPFKFFFGAPSCVPATNFETSGGKINSEDIKELLRRDDIFFLSEVMNYLGVIKRDDELIRKIRYAREIGKKIDGHAPGLIGQGLSRYAETGIETDHECISLDEAQEKIKHGMHILIREGSAARNLKELIGLVKECTDKVMLCTDDLHPDDLIRGHINKLVTYGLSEGIDIIDLITAATLNPVKHYGINVGLLQEGDPADFIVVDSLEDFKVTETYIDGLKVYANGESLLSPVEVTAINNFAAREITEEDLLVEARAENIRVIIAKDKQLITGSTVVRAKSENGSIIADPDNDVLKVVVLNRYRRAEPAKAFIRGFGIRNGAIASSIAHDSHNIIAVGSNDTDLASAINQVIRSSGGIAASHKGLTDVLPLNIAGIMSDKPATYVAGKYEELEKKAREMGSELKSVFMTLSFMALLVIPELKLSDLGLFDAANFRFVSMYA